MEQNNRVIVLGASAGGVDALLRMAPRLGHLQAPVLVVLHIGAHRSLMPELLNARGPGRAVFAQPDDVPVAGSIYVAPPDKHLLLEGGRLHLYSGPKENHARPAINPLFRSAALDRGADVVGVILTGTLDDGAAGLYAIKACGGVAVVQDPATAAESSMPRCALATVDADHVVDLEDLPELLGRLAGGSSPMALSPPAPDWLRVEHAITLGKMEMDELATIGAPSRFTCPDCGGALFELSEGRPVRYLCHTGHSFTLRSLASTQSEATDEAMWSALRALQEKEALLRRLATVQGEEGSGSRNSTLAEADGLRTVIDNLRSLLVSVPASMGN